MKVKIIAEKSSYKGQIHEADYFEGNEIFPYRIRLHGLMTYWNKDEIEVIEVSEKDEEQIAKENFIHKDGGNDPETADAEMGIFDEDNIEDRRSDGP